MISSDALYLYDKRLSLKAKGLLSYLLVLPNGMTMEDISIERLSKELKEGRESIGSTMTELFEQGYLSRERERTNKGGFGRMIYTPYAVSQCPESSRC